MFVLSPMMASNGLELIVDDSQNRNAKQAIINEFDWAEEAGYTLNNPNFKTFYLANANAKIYDEDGNILAEENF